MKKLRTENLVEVMVDQFRYPAERGDRYLILQNLPQDVILNLAENGFDLPMPMRERRAVVEAEHADVIEKLITYGCDNPVQLLLSFNSIERACEAIRNATSKQVKAFIDMFAV